jgi:hypothetical protein
MPARAADLTVTTGVQSQSLMRTLKFQLPVILSLIVLAGCVWGENLSVTSLQLGRSLNADNTVASHTTRFAPGDTIYVAVMSQGLGSGTIGIRWTYAGRVVGESTKQVSYTDAAATEFHIQSPVGFPVGDYTVEAFLDGVSVGTRTFRVDKER